jgi:hypothetical protein
LSSAQNQIPLQVSMGGGYSPDNKTIIEATLIPIEQLKYFLKMHEPLIAIRAINNIFYLITVYLIKVTR